MIVDKNEPFFIHLCPCTWNQLTHVGTVSILSFFMPFVTFEKLWAIVRPYGFYTYGICILIRGLFSLKFSINYLKRIRKVPYVWSYIVFFNFYATQSNHSDLLTTIRFPKRGLLIQSIKDHAYKNTTTIRMPQIWIQLVFTSICTQNLAQGYQILSHKHPLSYALLRAKSLPPLLKYETN